MSSSVPSTPRSLQEVSREIKSAGSSPRMASRKVSQGVVRHPSSVVFRGSPPDKPSVGELGKVKSVLSAYSSMFSMTSEELDENAQKSRIRRRYTKRLGEEEGTVLDPEHPLLEKFQRALKEHLLRQIEVLKDEVYGFETAAKKKNIEREELGIETYEWQQMVRVQQKSLKNISEEVKSVSAARQEMELRLEEAQKRNREEKEALAVCEKEESELRIEIESTHYLIKQMSNWENQVESNVTVSKRIAEKTRKDRLRLVQEKRQQDAVMYRLVKEVWRLEDEIKHMDTQLHVMESEREALAEAIAFGNTNVEALTEEYNNLMHSWNSVLIAISSRDKTLSCLKEKLHAHVEKMKAGKNEMDQIKRLIKREMEENEKLTLMRSRIEQDIKTTKNLLNEQATKRAVIEDEMGQLQATIDETERSIQSVQNENNSEKLTLNAYIVDFDRHQVKKYELEEKIVNALESNVTSNKATHHLYLRLEKVKEVNRHIEITVGEGENKYSAGLLQMEVLKIEIEETKTILQDLEAKQTDLIKEGQKLESENDKLDFAVNKKQKALELSQSKLFKVTMNKEDISKATIEVKIASLEKSIEQQQEKNKDMQRFWLREQRNLVALTQQRHDQIRDINLIKKQIMILEQKNLLMNDEVAANRKIEEQMLRNVHVMRSRLTTLCEQLCQRKGMKTLLDKGNEVIEQEYVSRLKDAELDCLRIESDIAEMEDDKVTMSRRLVELNREALEWEKKLLLARETRDRIRDEQGPGGEMGTMRAEIHRMEIRYSQLRKAQDKLIQDLEHCIARRDAIFSQSEARERRLNVGTDSIRIMYVRKLDDMRNKVKKNQDHIRKWKKAAKLIERKRNKLSINKDQLLLAIEELARDTADTRRAIRDTDTDRMMKCELLVLKQRKLNMYVDLAKGRTPYTVYRTDGALTSEYARQRDVNTKLCLLVVNLIGDFPQYRVELNRILNSLKLPAFIMY